MGANTSGPERQRDFLAAITHVLDRLPEPLLIVSSSGAIQSGNRVAARLLARHPEDLTGVPLASLCTDAPGRVAAHLRSWSSTGQPTPGALDLLCTEGDAIRCRVDGAVIRPGDGQTESLLLLRLMPRRESASQFTLLNRKISELSNEIARRMVTEQRLEMLADIASALLAAGRPRDIVTHVYQKLTAHLAVDACLSYLVEEGTILRLDAHPGLAADRLAGLERLGFDEAVCGAVAVRRTPIVVEAVQLSDAPMLSAVRALGFDAYAAFPLIAGDQLIGTLSFGRRSHKPFTPDEIGVLSTVANQAAIAIERVRALVREREARHEAELASQVKDEFLATLSHELRTPLNAVLGWASLLMTRTASSPEQRRGLEAIHRNAIAQSHLIEDILDVSRIVTGKLRIHSEPTALLPVLAAAVESVRPAAAAKHIAIETAVDRLDAFVLGDGARLQQVFWNLLSNGVKFTPRGGRLSVAARVDGSDVVVEVADSGIGIAPEFLPHVFERFRQADATSTRAFGGIGLGLAIARQIVEAHGGWITAESRGLDAGATFTVRLPIYVGASLQEESYGEPLALQIDPPAPRHVLEADSLSGVHVLAVDDEPDAREIVALGLRQHGARVSLASSVAEAVDLYQRERPDVIVSDIAMPGEDGYALIRRVRAAEAGLQQTPALALTAYAGPEVRTAVLRAGFDEYLARPVDPATLAKTIARLSTPGTRSVNDARPGATD